MTNLARCPCGEIPSSLFVMDGDTYRTHVVSGTCCGEWSIDVKLPIELSIRNAGPISPERMEYLESAWNAAPRGNENE